MLIHDRGLFGADMEFCKKGGGAKAGGTNAWEIAPAHANCTEKAKE